MEAPAEGAGGAEGEYICSSRAGAATGPGGAANLENRILRSEDRRDRQAKTFGSRARRARAVKFPKDPDQRRSEREDPS